MSFPPTKTEDDRKGAPHTVIREQDILITALDTDPPVAEGLDD
jgi:hypothetical protein